MDGEPLEIEPRRALQRVVDEQAAKLSLEFTVGSELEFYLLDRTTGQIYASNRSQTRVCDLDNGDGNPVLRLCFKLGSRSMG